MYLTGCTMYILAVLLTTTWKFGITMKKIEQDNQCNNQHLWDKLKCPIEKVFNFEFICFYLLTFWLQKAIQKKYNTFSSCPFSLYVVNPKFQGVVYSLGIYIPMWIRHSCTFFMSIYGLNHLLPWCPGQIVSSSEFVVIW